MFTRQKLRSALLASFMCLGLFSAKAQTDPDLPAKGQLKPVVTLPQPKLGAVQTIYQAQAFADWQITGFKTVNKGIGTGKYANNASLKAVGKPVALPKLVGEEQIYLKITDEFVLEYQYDLGRILVSKDGGATWESVYTVSGSTAKRNVWVNLSAYAGQTVQLAVAFTSDASFESAGWTLHDLSLLKADPTKAGANQRLQATKEIKITGINTTNFPEYVYVDFEYLENGVQMPSALSVSDINLNAFLPGATPLPDMGNCGLRLYGPDVTKRQVDIIFLIDNSGSMSDKQQQVKDNITNFVNAIGTANNDVAFGMLRFGQAGPPIEQLEVLPGLTGLPTDNFTKEYTTVVPPATLPYYQTELANRNVAYGGTERGYEALKLALTANFRPSAQKIFVLVTDENVTDQSNMGPTTKAQIIAALKQQSAIVYAWVPSIADYDATYADVALQTGGKRYDIYQPIMGLLTDISNALKGTYTLRFCTAEKGVNAIPHGVTISLQSDNTVYSTRTYTVAPSQEYIVRDAATIAKGNGNVPQNSATQQLCFEVKDNAAPYATSAQLFVRHINSTGAFTAVTMVENTTTPANNRKWCGTVPASVVLDPGFSYYAVATYADGHQLKSPPTKEAFFAWTQAVDPNLPPKITVTAPTAAVKSCTSTNLTFTVTDATNGFKDVRLYYREIGAPSAYTEVVKYSGALITSGTYTQALTVTGKGIEYFITATDNYNIVGYAGDMSIPKQILTLPATVVPTTSVMYIDFEQIKIECTALKVGDVIRAYYKDACGLLALAGEKVFDPLDEPVQTLEVYGNTGGTNKNGYDANERLYVQIERASKTYNVKLPNATNKYVVNTTIAMTGNSISPTVNVVTKYQATVVPINDVTPSAAEGTKFDVSIPTPRVFNVTNSGCGTFALQGVSNTNTADFTASFDAVANTVTVTYLAATNNAKATIDITYTGGNYPFDVEGTIVACPKSLFYGSVSIPNGDLSPTVAKGTDFGTTGSPSLHSFALSGTCTPALSVTNVTSTNPDFTVANVGTTINVTYSGAADASGTITVNTNNGPFTFNVKGAKPACVLTLKYGTVTVPNGDITPTATEGTDFGAASAAITRPFVLSGACTPALAITNVASSSANFVVTYTGLTVNVKYTATTANATGKITVTTNNGNYVFDVKGTTSVCTRTVKYGTSTAITNGDNTPSVAEGSDFGSISLAVTRTFVLSGTGCNPAATISAASTNNANFTVTYTATTVDVKYTPNADATGIVTLVTNYGNFTFTVTGKKFVCVTNLKFGTTGTQILNGDATPTVAKGTDYGTVSLPLGRTFNFSGASCTPPPTISAVSVSNTNFSASVASATSVLVTYNATVDASAVVTLTTNYGSFTFTVTGKKSVCGTSVVYGAVTIPNGDITPTVVEGTDFGTVSLAKTNNFALQGTSGCNPAAAIATVSSNNTNFVATKLTATTFSVKFNATVAATGTITVTTNYGSYTFQVKGAISTCVRSLSYGGTAIANGDATPSTTDGTDYGATNYQLTHTFALQGTNCNPGVTISSVTSSNPNFVASFSGLNIDVTYTAIANATSVITVVTNYGNYTFTVTGIRTGNCVSIAQYTGNYLKISIDMTSLVAGSNIDVTGQIVNSMGVTVQSFPTQLVYTSDPNWHCNFNTFPPGQYFLRLQIARNNACSGLFTVQFAVQ